MKREIVYYSILTLGIIALLFFETDLFRAETTTETRVIKGVAFDKLDIDLDCNIFVSLGDEQKVVLEGPAYYINNVKTSTENGVLKISRKAPGLFASLFASDQEAEETAKVYVKLTSVDQLMKPDKANVISNEALKYVEYHRNSLFSLNTDFSTLFSIFGKQTGQIIAL